MVIYYPEIAFITGLTILTCLISLLITCILCDLVVSAIKEYITGKKVPHLRSVTIICRIIGYTRNAPGSIWDLHDKNGKFRDADGVIASFVIYIVLLSLAVALYPLTILLLIVYCLLRLARFTYRVNETADKHLNNKEIHNAR